MENTKTKTMETTKRFDNSPIELEKRKYKMYLSYERDKYKMLYNQTYDETFKSVHSGKNKYRLKNTIKEQFKNISKKLDVLKSEGMTIDEVLEVVTEGCEKRYNKSYK